MGLIRKGSSKDTQNSAEGRPQQESRSGRLLGGSQEKKAVPKTESSFEGGFSVQGTAQGAKRVLGRRKDSKPQTGLPELETVVVGGDGSQQVDTPEDTSVGAVEDINSLLTHTDSMPAPAAVAPVGPPVDEQIIAEAQAKAEQIVLQAEEKVQEMVQQAMAKAEAQAQAMAQEAQEKGYEVGLTKGQDEAKRVAQEALSQQMREGIALYNQAVKEYKRVLSQSEGQVVDFALVIVKKLMGAAIKGSKEAAFALVRQAILELQDREEVLVKVHPDALEHVRSRQDELQKLIEGLKSFKVLGDPKLNPGDCLLETNLGNVDARLSVQLSAIEKALQETRELRVQEIEEQLAQEEPRERDIPVVPEEPEYIESAPPLEETMLGEVDPETQPLDTEAEQSDLMAEIDAMQQTQIEGGQA